MISLFLFFGFMPAFGAASTAIVDLNRRPSPDPLVRAFQSQQPNDLPLMAGAAAMAGFFWICAFWFAKRRLVIDDRGFSIVAPLTQRRVRWDEVSAIQKAVVHARGWPIREVLVIYSSGGATRTVTLNFVTPTFAVPRGMDRKDALWLTMTGAWNHFHAR